MLQVVDRGRMPVTTFVDLLRAVNVSGQNRLPMADLRTALTGTGFEGVETYVQSGNIVCEGPEKEPEAHAAAVHDLIAERFGLDVTVLTLTGAGLADTASANPFLRADPAADSKWLHVTFLAEAVTPAAFEALALPAADGEAAALSDDGRRIYLRLPSGYGRTKLNNAWFERALKTRATTRNWRTVQALNELAAARR
jgi:uncharacterized protein (DUF1697 family)